MKTLNSKAAALTVFGSLLVMSNPGFAEGLKDRVYVFGGVGVSKIDAGRGYTASSGSLTYTQKGDGTGVSYGVGAGYNVNDWLSIEGKGSYTTGFGITASLNANNANIGGVVYNGNVNVDAEIDGWTLQVTPKVSYKNGGFEAFGRAGVAYTRVNTDVKASGSGTVNGTTASASARVKVSSNEFNPVIGVGASYYFSDAFALRGDVEHIRNVGDENTGESNVNTYSLSLVYKF